MRYGSTLNGPNEIVLQRNKLSFYLLDLKY